MNPKTARRILATHFEDPNGDIPADVEKALTIVEKNPELISEYREQAALDKKAARLLGEIEIPESTIDTLSSTVSSLPASRFRWNDPAMLAVLIGVILLVCVLAWDFLGRPASFPGDAIEIASTVSSMTDDKFETAGLPAGEMDDWFVLKGFDGFIAPGRLAALSADSAALIKSERVPLAVLEMPGKNLRVASFDSNAMDIQMPEMEWRFTQIDPALSAAIRLEGGQCVLVIHPGPVEFLKRELE